MLYNTEGKKSHVNPAWITIPSPDLHCSLAYNHFFLLSDTELPMAVQDCRLMTHTLVILNTLPKPPASAAAQNFQYLLGSFFFSIRKMLKLYLLWTARATLLMSWSDCPQRTIMLEFYFILQPIPTEKGLIFLPIRNITCKVSSI